MNVLIVKTSSMGDVVHTLPALTDAAKHIPDVRFDWVVEEGFKEIPTWHSQVERVLPVAWRRWRWQLASADTQAEIKAFCRELRATRYDLIIDAQGLLKSAAIALLARGKRSGFSVKSAREPLAAFTYQKRQVVSKNQHAVTRVRELFAKSLNYSLPDDQPDYGLAVERFMDHHDHENYLLFIHGTTWPTKLWPQTHWIALAQRLVEKGWNIKLPWGNEEEKMRAEQIAQACPLAEVLPRCRLSQLAGFIAQARAIVAVDTGLGHLAAALGTPTVSLYGPTSPLRVGTYGQRQVHLQAAGSRELASLTPERVEQELNIYL